MINSIEGIVKAAQTGKKGIISVAGAHDSTVMSAAIMASEDGLVTPIFVGHSDEIVALLKEMGKDANDYEIIDGGDDVDCSQKAVELCSQGRATFLMKGIVNTADFMRAVFKKENGLRTNSLTSHVMFYEAPAYERLFIMTDGAINTFPDLEKKANILENAARVLQALGYESINAAVICGAETINPKIQSTLDADALSRMTERWAPYHMNVYGPAALDLAISKDACAHKHYDVPGAGEADILLMPSYEVGNGMGKAFSLFGGAKSAGIVIGAKAPIVLVSRSDSAQCKKASIALGSLMASRMKFE